jgi:acyl carrier protein
MDIIRNILIQKIGHDNFDKDTVLSEVLDSLDMVDVVMRLEKHYCIEITADEQVSLRIVSDIYDVIMIKTKNYERIHSIL